MNFREIQSYQHIYNRLIGTIKKSKGLESTITFSVPAFVLGNSSYNLKKCIIFLMKKIRDETDYIVTYKNPNYLLIFLSYDNRQKIKYFSKKISKYPQYPQFIKSPPKIMKIMKITKIPKSHKSSKNSINKDKITDQSIIDIIQNTMIN